MLEEEEEEEEGDLVRSQSKCHYDDAWFDA